MWTGLAIKLAYGARLVYDSHELWPDRNGRWEWRPWLLAGEALFVRAADEVITSSPGYADALAGRYRVARPLVVRNIPEYRSSEPALPPQVPAPTPRLRRRHPFAARATGLSAAGRVRGWADAWARSGADDRLACLPARRAPVRDRARVASISGWICSCGPERPASRSGWCFAAPVAPGEVQGVLAGAAAGLCLIQPICRSYELSLPNKLFEYAAAGVPVLASDAPVIAAVVRAHGLGQVVATDRPTGDRHEPRAPARTRGLAARVRAGPRVRLGQWLAR